MVTTAKKPMTDAQILAAEGITIPAFVRMATKKVPCGIETVEEALADNTLAQVNVYRALAVVHWKGFVDGLRMAEQVITEKRGRDGQVKKGR